MSSDRALLRSLSLATAVPLAFGGFANTAEPKEWRKNSPIIDLGEAAADLRPGSFVVLFNAAGSHSSSSASTTEATDTNIPPTTASTVAGNAASVANLDLDFLTRSMSQIGELLQSPPADLPDEQPIRVAAVASAVGVLLDLQDANAPVPSVIARGDGGLQLVWYAQDRDLEIEVLPRGAKSIIEFDGARTHRADYSSRSALSAVNDIRRSIQSAKDAAA